LDTIKIIQKDLAVELSALKKAYFYPLSCQRGTI
jgi:hypothetical protein